MSFDPGLGRSLHAENRSALLNAARTLQGLGHDVIEVSLPVQREPFIDSYAALIGADVAATLRYANTLIGRRATRADVELATWVLACMGEAQSAPEVVEALWAMQTFSRAWLQFCAGYDVLLTPTVGVPPLPIGAYALPAVQRRALEVLTALPGGVLMSQRARIVEAFEPIFEAAPFTMIANVTGQPSMSLPLHWTADGLPMGLLFTGARIGDDAVLFQLAAQLERTMPWGDRIAPNAIP
jgi:amidase